MDYTTTANVKTSFGIVETGDDALIASMVTRASRAIDRMCAGAATASDNYLMLETITDEMPKAIVDGRGRLVVYPHKPVITGVTALAYRFHPREAWQTVDAADIIINDTRVIAWTALDRQPVEVRITYAGGLAASPDALPADIIEAATVLAGRYYKEAQAGVTDVVGVAELGVLKYAKATPVRVERLLRPYRRVLPW